MSLVIRPSVCHEDGEPIPEFVPDGAEGMGTVPAFDASDPLDLAIIDAMTEDRDSEGDGER